MIKRYRILAEDSARTPPIAGENATYTVALVNNHSSTIEQLTVHITAVDTNWGPKFARIEGFVRDDCGAALTVLGFHYTDVATKNSIGLLEVHSDED